MKKYQSVQRISLGVDDPAYRPGGYRSEGTPGEEAAAQRPMRVLEIGDENRVIRQMTAVKGGVGAESTSAGRLEEAEAAVTTHPEGPREVFVLTRRDSDYLETPVFEAGEGGGQAAIAVFTGREKAELFLQASGWGQTHTRAQIGVHALGQWLRQAESQGIPFVAIDLDWQEHQRGEPQPVLLLSELPDKSDDSLYDEVWALGRP